MKKIISLIITLMLMLSFGAVSASAAPKLNSTNFTLTKGYQTTLKVSGNSGSVQWGSSDTSVATVSSGKVIGKSVGTAVISAVVDGMTLRSTVNVVATKITSDKTAVTVEKGKYVTVTLTVNGDKSGMTLSSANSKVAKGSWAGAKWDGNKITLRITGVAPGTSSVTVYRKNYRSSYYKTITVTVPGAVTPTIPTTPSSTITTSVKTLSVTAGGSSQFQVYTTTPNNIAFYSSDTTIATATAGTSNGNYRVYNVTGVKAGTATIRVYDRTNQSIYSDVAVTVTGSTYYIVSTTRPTATGTDEVVTFQKNGANYYMLVPYSYDEADVNSAIAKYFNTYDYYTVYSTSPTIKTYGDTIRNFTKANTDPYNPYNPANPYNPYNPGYAAYSPRYILIPRDFDEVKLNTAEAKYTGEYDYYTVYNSRPVNTARSDVVQTWKIIDNTGVTITRYVILPSGYDTNRFEQLKAADIEENQSFSLYVATDIFPTNPGAGNQVFSWRNPKSGKYRYMVVPTKDCDFLARNDAVYKDTGVYCYFNAYSSSPTVASGETREYVVSMYIQSGSASKMAYILVDKTDPDYEQKLQDIQSGYYYFIEQGDFATGVIQY
ncbi:MAG: hypothetical protein LBL80_01620 [Ruminococcus sp.]|jgi:hypothetical protein|nr:hypothetical protein [Ruminococcus sp.]